MKKNILICGASKNLGKYLSKKFLYKYNVIRLSSTLKTNNENIFRTEITNKLSLNSALVKIKKKRKNLHAIIFTVGYSQPTKGDLESYKKSFDINFFSLVNLINSYLKVFAGIKTKIVVISSIAGIKSINAPIEYAVSKAALIYYVKIVSKQLIKKGISINTISPGNILMKKNNWSKKIKTNKTKVMKYLKENVPSNKFVRPEEIYKICELIISEKNLNLVGSNIVIDGGQSI